jgi:hypothetical protein
LAAEYNVAAGDTGASAAARQKKLNDSVDKEIHKGDPTADEAIFVAVVLDSVSSSGGGTGSAWLGPGANCDGVTHVF